MTTQTLTGRTALITGAGVGIGAATAKELAQAGAFVGIHYRSSGEPAKALLSDIRDAGGDGILLQGDLTNQTDATRIVKQLIEARGTLHILVNNAGSPIKKAKLADYSLELWNEVIATNLTSAFLVTQQAIPHLTTTDAPAAIVNNLSLSVQTGGAGGAGAYAAAKGGLQVMTRTLARELAPHVRVNAVMPGVIETAHHDAFTSEKRMAEYRQETPLARNGSAHEVAAVIAFLVSDAATFVNGSIVDINGGRFLR